MAKKKKVVVTTSKPAKSSNTLKPTKSTLGKGAQTPSANALSFGKDNYIYMLVGAGLIFIGMLLMSGGQMPSPDVWDDSIIYSTRRTLIAPIFILAGLVVEIFAIFK
ncbi:DUF3098 domain-containing protein [Portibacter marinus]|uniref:DUF3098 domain-containing protein n=1 Tax=Portibacter marinus TaxID=2898660 RepID=UPI001F3D9683|nr:DUF3098 domain-containing protein [Portibacter marinus]